MLTRRLKDKYVKRVLTLSTWEYIHLQVEHYLKHSYTLSPHIKCVLLDSHFKHKSWLGTQNNARVYLVHVILTIA